MTIKTNKNVSTRLKEARKKLHSLKLKKSGKNSFSGYSYFELEDFLPHIVDIFDEVGLLGVVTFEPECAKLTIINCDDESNTLTFSSPSGSVSLKGCHEMQNVGAMQTYQRRYLWFMAMDIVEGDPLDKTHDKLNASTLSVVQTLTADQQEKVEELAEAAGMDLDDICKKLKVSSVESIPQNKFAGICKRLKDRIKENEQSGF